MRIWRRSLIARQGYLRNRVFEAGECGGRWSQGRRFGVGIAAVSVRNVCLRLLASMARLGLVSVAIGVMVGHILAMWLQQV